MSRLASRSGKMLIAASVMNSVSGWPGTSMTKTWLIRRSVRRPVAEAVTSLISSSVCRLPFIRSSPLPSRISATACAAAAWLCGASTISRPARSMPCSAATARIFASGPTSTGSISRLGRGLDRAAQRGLVAGMGDDGHRRRAVAGGGDQAIVLRVGSSAKRRMPPAVRMPCAPRHQLRAEAEERGDPAQARGWRLAGAPLASITLAERGEGRRGAPRSARAAGRDGARARPPRR